ncbi:MAG TPA: nucleotidyl transferase AbiEii/AbiGii toxin family protein [Acetobacteraceae bacterium]|jgi:hypothetical protein|nr:nucleotidyl transferase AbiEii/AbiGii toxin family protein [Acetobacteraceae bacterium]
MTDEFIPRLDILPKPQLRLWNELAEVPTEFVLYGGTAIALHLGHRQSVDFDFFGSRKFDPASLVASVSFLKLATIIRQEANTLTVLVNRGGPVKLSFFGLPRLPNLAMPHIAPENGLRVAALLDLAGTKVSVVQRRAEAKDYQDIDAMISDGRIDLTTALAAARAIYGDRFNPQITLKALSYFGDGKLRRLPRVMKDRLIKAVGEVDLDRLPAIARSKRRCR